MIVSQSEDAGEEPVSDAPRDLVAAGAVTSDKTDEEADQGKADVLTK